jgi:hypothetical protein
MVSALVTASAVVGADAVGAIGSWLCGANVPSAPNRTDTWQPETTKTSNRTISLEFIRSPALNEGHAANY